jgi:hypothetical protein
LQSGWILLCAPPGKWIGASFAEAAHHAAVWFQMLWIAAVWWWLRALGTRPRLAAGVIAAVIPSGFFIIHSVYVWPKLAAGALMLGAFIAWFLERDAEHRAPVRFVAGGALAALAYLAHGGAAFALLAIAPLAWWRWRRVPWRRWLLAGAAFTVLMLPWITYQKFYDPPGNRLLKWHLGGVIPPDERGTLETLLSSYSETPPAELWRHRVANFRVQIYGPWSELARFRMTRAQERRDAEFFFLGFALGWWNLGFAALAVLGVPWFRRWRAVEFPAGVWSSLSWALLTWLIWIGLMFLGGNAVIHQGSFTVPLLLLPLLALALWHASRIAFAAVLAAQLAAAPFLWMTPPPAMAALPRRFDAEFMVAAAVIGLGVAIWDAGRRRAGAEPARGGSA